MAVNTAKPDDLLHRYLLRKGMVRKVRHRIGTHLRWGTRDAFGDAAALVPKPKTVFDVGANIGYVAHSFHKRWPEASITCFEPTPETFERLSKNLSQLPQITCVRAAISDRDGVATFHVDNEAFGGGSNSLLDHAKEFDLTAKGHSYEGVEVATRRIDSYCNEKGIDHIDVMKIDVEGAEPLVLDGASELLERSAIDVIISEVRLVPGYEGGVLLHELTEKLSAHGYRPFGVYRFATSAIGQSLWGDAIFLGPQFRAKLISRHGAEACGFVD
ncbi:MAG: FkbM family methyltransferase [Acidimicrobiales bacterium]|nr:FkbM family methyltransferase [Acidimicrobiales bacterium]MCB1245973.1 FkbM family methyltransferase [Acidimicrobiia bacterium]